ncbi:MAG: phosphatidylglycerophosphatase A, partial [Pseudomonadota bacterium]
MTRESNIGLTLKDLAAPDVLWASAFGAGFCRPAPGTWGSVLAVGVWWFGLSALPVWQQLLVVLFYFCSGWWVSRRICLRYQVDDAPQIVADEVAGMWLALAFLPQAVLPQAWWLALLALILFRLLDIL